MSWDNNGQTSGPQNVGGYEPQQPAYQPTQAPNGQWQTGGFEQQPPVGYDQQQGYAQQPQWTPPAAPSGPSAFDAFVDFGFKNSITRLAAPLVFILVTVFAFFKMVAGLIAAWSDRGGIIFGMGTGSGGGDFGNLWASLGLIVGFVTVVAVTRVILGALVHLEDLATKAKSDD